MSARLDERDFGFPFLWLGVANEASAKAITDKPFAPEDIGEGLTVIANAPNPAGQSILQKHFEGGISPAGLFLGAFVPTIIMALSFMVIFSFGG